MSSSSVEKYAIHPAATALVSGLLVYGVLGNAGTYSVLGREMSPALAVAASMFAADIASTVATDLIADADIMPDSVDETQKMLVKPVLNSIALLASVRVLVGTYKDSSGMLQVLALGGMSSVGGSYMSDLVTLQM